MSEAYDAGLRAQAKINLRLKVLALGESGYHSIETVFQRLELADRITVSPSRIEIWRCCRRDRRARQAVSLRSA